MAELILKVGASSDDAYQKIDATGYSETDIVVYCRTGSAQRHGGCRFTGVTIPQGATIDSAIFAGYTNTDDDPHVDFYGDDVDDSITFDPTTNDIVGRTKTTATVAWAAVGVGENQYVDSPDLKTIIQEIVDRGSWASGNALTLILWEDGDATTYRYQFDTWDATGTNEPKLTINYTVASGFVPYPHPRGLRAGMGELVGGIH